MNSGFLDKLIERIGRVRPEDVQSYLLRLADEKGFLETIFNAIHEGVIVTDLEGRINYLNRAACELFGLEREKCMGEPLARAACAASSGRSWSSSEGGQPRHGGLLSAAPLPEFLRRAAEPRYAGAASARRRRSRKWSATR